MPRMKIIKDEARLPDFQDGETFMAFPKRQKEPELFVKVFTLPWMEKLKDEALNTVNARVLIFCLISSDREGKLDFTQREIAQFCGVVPSVVSRSIRILLRMGILVKTKSVGGHNRLWLSPNFGWKSTPASRGRQKIVHYNVGNLFDQKGEEEND